jgi:hypothetical protein
MLLETLQIDAIEFERRTGWAIKPEGVCKEDRCVPLPDISGNTIDASLLADRLGMPLVHDEASGLWCLGPEAGGRALNSAMAPALALPDLNGELVHLSALRGTKVLLVAWASW